MLPPTPSTEGRTESQVHDPCSQPGLTCERALRLPTGNHHAHGLTAAPGSQQGSDGHPHCTDVETEAQADAGRHSGSSAPSTRLVLQCDMWQRVARGPRYLPGHRPLTLPKTQSLALAPPEHTTQPQPPSQSPPQAMAQHSSVSPTWTKQAPAAFQALCWGPALW